MSDDGDIYMRASSLPGYPDCARRWAARMCNDRFGGPLAAMVRDAGYSFRTLPPNIGAITGTATHTGVARINQHHMDTGEISGSGKNDEDAALAELDTILEDGCVWDATTPRRDTAQKQVRRQVAAYRKYVAPKIKPVSVEERMQATVRPGIILTGQMDVAEDDEIADLKTGVIQRANAAQYGAYSLLRRSAGHTVSKLKEQFVKRCRANGPQEKPIITDVPVDVAERAAWEVIRRIEYDMEKFAETGEPWSFLANPSSMLCGDKWCSAWGTRFCRQHKGAK